MTFHNHQKQTAIVFVLVSIGLAALNTQVKSQPEEGEELLKHGIERMASQRSLRKLESRFWYLNAVERLHKHRRHLNSAGFPPPKRNRRVRNVILVLGDGHGPTSVTASRLYKEEFSGKKFYENELVVDSFPFSGWAKTYALDELIADSASTATAYQCGVKTLNGHVGVDVTADLDCNSDDGFLPSIANWAKDRGKSTGFVTTASIAHASPAPLYAHTPHRSHYTNNSRGLRKYPKCIDIAQQFILKAGHINVALGGGESYFIPNTTVGSFGWMGDRIDGRNLIDEWVSDRSRDGSKAKHVRNAAQLNKITATNTDYLLGMFAARSLPFVNDGPSSSIPTLAEMAKKAIEVLDKNPNGYYLFVEGARIDNAHHHGQARKALREAIEMDKALGTIVSMVNLTETLIVVTADHSHTLTLGGDLKPGQSVLSVSGKRANDGKNFTILQYANGPGAEKSRLRSDVNQKQAIAQDYRQQALVPLGSETHGGEDVGVYSIGPYAELFTGVYAQNYIAIAMACAGGLMQVSPFSTSSEDICPEPWLGLK